MHDSQPLDDLLTEQDEGQPFHADCAYTGEDQEKVIILERQIKNIIF